MRPIYKTSNYEQLVALLEREGDTIREVLVSRSEMQGIMAAPREQLVQLFPSYKVTVDKLKRVDIKRKSLSQTMDTRSQEYYDAIDKFDMEELELKACPDRMLAVFNGREIPVVVSIKA